MYFSVDIKLTHTAVMVMLQAAIAQAEKDTQPQCIVIVDASGEILAQIRMTGAKFLSMKSARAKALTAASIGAQSAVIPEAVGSAIAAATSGDVTPLGGALPIFHQGHLVGGIADGHSKWQWCGSKCGILELTPI